LDLDIAKRKGKFLRLLVSRRGGGQGRGGRESYIFRDLLESKSELYEKSTLKRTLDPLAGVFSCILAYRETPKRA
jgi:hypothetical protein